MDCDVAREALSALIDGERLGVDQSALDRHLAGCAGCSAWRERAHEVTRRARLVPARRAPVAGERVRALAHRRHAPAWRRTDVLVRALLALIGALQLGAALPVLILGSDHGAPIHVAHEMGSFDAALAVGFVLAAARPSRARGMSALVGAVAVLLLVTAVLDLAAGRTSPSDEAPHLLAVAGFLLLRRLAALTPAGEHGGASLPRPALMHDRSASGALIVAGREPRDDHGHIAGDTAVRAEPERRRAASG